MQTGHAGWMWLHLQNADLLTQSLPHQHTRRHRLLSPIGTSRPERSEGMVSTRLYRNGVLELEGFPVQDISDYVQDPSAVVWLDYCSPSADDLAAISEELGLHALAVEDAIHEHQRPKLDRYDSHLFLTSYAVSLDATTGELATSEIAAFVTSRR